MFEGLSNTEFTPDLFERPAPDYRNKDHYTEAGNHLIDKRKQESPLKNVLPVQYERIYTQIVSAFEVGAIRDWVVSCSVAKVGKGKHQTQSNDLDIFTTRDGVENLFEFFSSPEGRHILSDHGLYMGREEVELFGSSLRLAIAGEHEGQPIDIEIFGEGGAFDLEDQGGTIQLGGFREVNIYQHTMQYTDEDGRKQEVLYQDVAERELRQQYIRVVLREIMVTHREFQHWLDHPENEELLDRLAKKIPSRFQSILQLCDSDQKKSSVELKKEWVSALREMSVFDTKLDKRGYSLPTELVESARSTIDRLFENGRQVDKDQSMVDNVGLTQFISEIQNIPLQTGTLKTVYEGYFSGVKTIWKEGDIPAIRKKMAELQTLIDGVSPMNGLFFKFLLEMTEQVAKQKYSI